jgi:prevent-host-death family protein
MTMVITLGGGCEMARMISKSKFKPRTLQYFRQVEETGEELIITDHGKPVLKVMPYAAEPSDALQALRNSVTKYEHPTDPVCWEAWEALK